jgi:hypothetical protein
MQEKANLKSFTNKIEVPIKKLGKFYKTEKLICIIIQSGSQSISFDQIEKLENFNSLYTKI